MERSSGNVFTDLGLPHPEQELLKAKLTLQIYRLIKRRGITVSSDEIVRAMRTSPPPEFQKIPAEYLDTGEFAPKKN